MRIDNLFTDSDDISVEKQVITVNKYENPQQSLDLIAHICTAQADIDISDKWEIIDTVATEIEMFASEQNLNTDLPSRLKEIKSTIVSDIEGSGTKLKIAVGGGYSAGKSSFLNAITGIGSMLPTGIDPVSIVNTYLNCNSGLQKIIIRGENLKKASVLLNEDVLASIQHSSKSKIYIASVLNKLVIDIPVEAFLDNITFIDTPGYNNSADKNQENDITDKDTALKAINEADALFWCIDIDAGTVTQNDFAMLRLATGKPVVIFFTKMDKKPQDEVDRILAEAWKLCEKILGKENLPIDIVGVIANAGVPYFKSFSGFSFERIINFIKREAGKKDILEYYRQKVSFIFDSEIKRINETLEECESDRKNHVKEKDEWHEILMDSVKNMKAETESYKEIIIDSYDEICGAFDKISRLCSYALDGWSDNLDREAKWQEKAGFFSDTSSLVKKNNKSVEQYNKIADSYNAVISDYSYYTNEYRKNIYESLTAKEQQEIERIKTFQKDAQNEYKSTIDIIDRITKYRFYVTEKSDYVLNQFEELFEDSLNYMKQHNAKLQLSKTEEPIDIFSAIKRNRYEDFLSCFSVGVDMTVSNDDGYSPLTLAVKFGNNEMVHYFLEHGANPQIPDKRGYNAFETAVIYHYQDICEMLLNYDKSLAETQHDLDTLISLNTFPNWIHNITAH